MPLSANSVDLLTSLCEISYRLVSKNSFFSEKITTYDAYVIVIKEDVLILTKLLFNKSKSVLLLKTVKNVILNLSEGC